MPIKLFGTSGIRGNIATKVTVDLAMQLGFALGTFLDGRGLVGVGTDARTSKEMLKGAFVSGLSSTGVDVVDLGIAPMPTVAYYSIQDDISASVVVTASHNPPSDNGFKFFVTGREFLRSKEKILEKLVSEGNFKVADWRDIGNVHKLDIRRSYLNRIKKFALDRGKIANGMKVLIDSANGAASEYTPHLLRELGFSVTTVNSHPDGHFPGRLPEPSPKNLQDTMKIAAESDFAVTIGHDGDGDRLAVIDEEGHFIDQNRIIALFARDELERRGGGTVLVSIDTSSVIDEVVKKVGGEVVRAPLGALQELLVSKEHDIIFASEPWKPIFPEIGHWMDGIAGAARIAQMVNELGDGSCIKLMDLIPEYPVLREHISCPDKLKPHFIPLMKDILMSEIKGIERVLEEDGIRIEYTDGSYVLVRVSGTEPKARLYVGAKTQTALDKIAKTARNAMKKALDESKKK